MKSSGVFASLSIVILSGISLSFLLIADSSTVAVDAEPRQTPIPLKITKIVFDPPSACHRCLPRRGFAFPEGPESEGCTDEVRVIASTNRPLSDGEELYHFVTNGHLFKKGPDTIWKVPRGDESHKIDVAGGIGHVLTTSFETASVESVEIICDYPCECPTIRVNGPEGTVSPGDKIIFEGLAIGGGQYTSSFAWEIEGGEALSANDASSIVVTAGSAGKIKATFRYRGDEGCNCDAIASAEVDVVSK